jgi:exopolyphosphatase/guanosine-5'-triphosphate,3'-diphosphate pyrophosphatase
MRYGIFDIGSNSLKFLAVERRGEQLRILVDQSIPTRLAEELIHSGELKDEAIERTLVALKQAKARADRLGVANRAAVATSAVRDSGNRKQFVRAATQILGTPVRVLSGEEEAATTFAGLVADAKWRKHDLFSLEVGGGSAQWVQGKGLHMERQVSLTLGCVRLRERFVDRHPVGAAGVERICRALHEQLQPALASFVLGDRHLIGTGGTATCLAAIELDLAEFDAAKVNHYVITRRQLADRIAHLQTLSLAGLAKVPGLPSKRMDLIIPGACVYYVTMEILGAQRLMVSVRGLRYGVLQQIMENEAQSKNEA